LLFFPQCFSFAGQLVDYILTGKVLGKLSGPKDENERKGSWLAEQDFHGSFSEQCYFCCCCFLPFSLASVTDHAHCGMVCKISSPCPRLMTQLSLLWLGVVHG